MRRCRQRSVNADQYQVLTYALLGEKEEPWCNQYVAEIEDCAMPEQMVRMGLLKRHRDVPGYRCYHVTQRGADAVGLWLPYD